jgi:hypothetical protein
MNSVKRAAATLLSVAAFTAAAVGTAQAAGRWQQDPVPAGVAGNVLAMTQIDQHTTWAAGFQLTTDGQSQTLNPMLLARDDRAGKGWKRIATPADGANSRINALSADGARNVWLVGDNDSSTEGSILTEHWDGKAWRTAYAPVPAGTLAAGFLGVATVGPRDAWAVGWTQRMRGDESYETGLVEHWDGKAWRQVKLSAGIPDTEMFAITATGPHDIWAGGVLTDGTDQPVLLHYDGHTWTRATVPDTGLYGEFNTVVATAPNDVWAAGRTLVDDKDRGHPLLAHYDGHTWKTIPAPGTGSISAIAPTPGGATVVGYDKTTSQAYGEQLDGTGWHSLNLPALGIDSAPNSLSARAGDITVGGYVVPDQTSPLQPLLLTASR